MAGETYPFGSLGILPHEFQVDVWLLVPHVLSTSVDILSVKESDVDNSRHESCETQRVCHGKGRTNQ